jgi:hypothetical protein
MKSMLAAALAVSALSAASAYAVPKAAPAPYATLDVPVAASAKVSPARAATASKPVLIAENRREFGSSYQRY